MSDETQQQKESLEQLLDRASEIVASWPEWKRGVLEAAMRATNDTPRPVAKLHTKPVAHKLSIQTGEQLSVAIVASKVVAESFSVRARKTAYGRSQQLLLSEFNAMDAEDQMLILRAAVLLSNAARPLLNAEVNVVGEPTPMTPAESGNAVCLVATECEDANCPICRANDTMINQPTKEG